MLTTRLLDSVENCSDLSEWDNLEAPSQYKAPSLQGYWLKAFIQHYGPYRDLAVTIVYEGDTPRLVMPLQKKGDTHSEFLCDETSDYNDFLYFEPDVAVLEHALDFWISNGIRTLRLQQIPPDSQTVEMLGEIAEDKGSDMSLEDFDPIPVVCAQPAKDIRNWSGVKSRRVARYQRKLNSLNTVSDVKFELVESKEHLLREFPAIKAMHIKRWASIGIRSKYQEERRISFIMDTCKDALSSNSLFMPLMKVNNVLASYIIAFRGGNVIFDWNTSFSLRFASWSPGALLLLHVLSNSQIYDFSKYNLMKGAESYKFIWTDVIDKNLSISLNLE